MEQGRVEERQPTTRRNWKRILTFTVLLLILVGSLSYYFLPGILRPLRRDSVPDGAYFVPWMKPNPSVSWLGAWSVWNTDIDSVMKGALKLSMVFRIEILTLNETRSILGTVYLGHDKDFLYVGGKFSGWYSNPYSGDAMLANYFNMLFDAANDGTLKFPEAGSNMAVYVDPRVNIHDSNATFPNIDYAYDDFVWKDSNPQHPVWEYASNSGASRSSLGDSAALYDYSTGAASIVYSKYLRSSATSNLNALQMRPGERWVMGFLFELGYDNWEGSWVDAVDGWPRNIYPYGSSNAS